MQIDFHYDVIYVLARYAGFSRADANIIAHSSQYVDDAEHGGVIKFTNFPSYYHIRTAHTALEEENKDATADVNTWVPFHFIPGNISDNRNDTAYISKMICRANSNIFNEMMCECIRQKGNRNSLYRLGISLHVYADTWAHQNFAGIPDIINCTKNIRVENGTNIFEKLLRNIKNNMLDKIIDKYLPLGHGSVQVYPDIPFIAWSYYDYLGRIHVIRNYERFIVAVEEIFRYLKLYQMGVTDGTVDGISDDVKDKILGQFRTIQGNKIERHMQWQRIIDNGYFLENDKSYPYIATGKDSWKGIALNSSNLNDKGYYTIDTTFCSTTRRCTRPKRCPASSRACRSRGTN